MSINRTIIDRGFAVIQSRSDGTKEVMVCDGVSAGQPKNIYATHFNVKDLKIHPGVRMERVGANSATKQVVEVASERPGEVHVRLLGHGHELVLEARALQ